MTMMIPDVCIDTSPVAKTLHQNLYNQLGPSYKIIQYIKKPKESHYDTALEGSIFWIQQKSQSLFIYLSDAPSDFFDKTLAEQKSIKDRLLHHPEFMALVRFQNRLLPKQLQNHKSRLTPFLMIFNNIHDKDEKKLHIGIKSLGLYLLGKESLASNALHNLVDTFMGDELSESSRHHLRCTFNPELAIYSHQVDNCLLDQEQEVAIKNDILLTEGTARDEHLNLRGVNGCINSGKSEVVLQRAKLFNQTDTHTQSPKKVLILTPDNVSQLSLNKRYYALNPYDKDTEVLSINQWCEQLLNTGKQQVNEDHIMGLVGRIVSKSLVDNGISLTVFLQEIDFILGRTIFSEKDYLKATRKLQSYDLSDNNHKHIWKALLTLKNELATSDRILEGELPQLLWSSIQQKAQYDHYDHIMLDDAHLLPPITFDLIKKLIKPKTGQLFITQNPQQSLLNSCRLWHDTGLELRGHSTKLLNNYQISPYILNAASSFYLHRLPYDTGKVIHRNLPEASQNQIPTLLHFHSHKDEDNRLLNKVRTLVSNGVKPDDILLISIQNESIAHYKNILKHALDITTTELNGLDNQQKNTLGVCSLLHAHGQQAPHVFIVGIHHIYETEKKCGVGTDEYKKLLRDNTKKLSVAMTCAKEELTLFLTSELIPRDFISPHIEIPSMSSDIYAEVHALHG